MRDTEESGSSGLDIMTASSDPPVFRQNGSQRVADCLVSGAGTLGIPEYTQPTLVYK